MRRTLTVTTLAVALAIITAAAAFAVTSRIGNDAIYRGNVDSYSNFTIVDTNHPAAFDGYFTSVNYYAHRAGTIRFVIVETGNVVTWMSDEINVTAAGSHTATFAAPVGITAGSNLGVYSATAGVVSWQYDGAAEPAEFTPNYAGLPTVDTVLDAPGRSDRYYSMNATITASSPDACKDGGWELYSEYKNQGQCIASFVANDHAGK